MNTKTMTAYKPSGTAPQILANVSSGIHPVITLTKQYNLPGGLAQASPVDASNALNAARKATWIDFEDPIIFDIIWKKQHTSMQGAIDGKYDGLCIELKRGGHLLGHFTQIRRASVSPWYCVDFKPLTEQWYGQGTEMVTASMLSKVRFTKDPRRENTFTFTIPE
jgi:hypothetical protein